MRGLERESWDGNNNDEYINHEINLEARFCLHMCDVHGRRGDCGFIVSLILSARIIRYATAREGGRRERERERERCGLEASSVRSSSYHLH